MLTTQLEKTAEQVRHRSTEVSIESIVSEHGPDLIALARSLGANDPEGVANEVLTSTSSASTTSWPTPSPSAGATSASRRTRW